MKHHFRHLVATAVAVASLGAAAADKTVTYYYADPQGTPLAEADANGNVTARYDYAPFGRSVLDSTNNGP